MKVACNDYGRQVFVPDDPALGSMLATVDPSGWVKICGIDGEYLHIDRDEWTAFVQFVNAVGEKIR